MNRILINTETGKKIPGYLQSGGYEHPNPEEDQEAYRKMNEDAVLQNGINDGLDPAKIKVKWVDDSELAEAIEASKPVPTEAELSELAITAKMVEISDRELRVKAVAEIEAENVAEK